LNFALGVFNLYPLWITDGGKIVIDLLSTIFKTKKSLVIAINLIFYSALSLLLFNMVGPYFL
jgi:membrane-associated protease RseP (regulator of RpoE activity)